MLEFWEFLFKLLMAHAVTDFGLQGDTMAKYKSRKIQPDSKILNKNQDPSHFWPYFLGSHGLINGAGVYLVTNSVLLAGVETLHHIFVDFLKCEGHLTLNQDQLLHVSQKVVYALVLVYGAFK